MAIVAFFFSRWLKRWNWNLNRKLFYTQALCFVTQWVWNCLCQLGEMVESKYNRWTSHLEAEGLARRFEYLWFFQSTGSRLVITSAPPNKELYECARTVTYVSSGNGT